MESEALYNKFAKYYDLVYAKKNYREELKFIEAVLKKHKVKGKSVLDVACGTGGHAKLLTKKGYHVIGVDKNKGILNVAKKKVPKAKFKQGDMKTFHLKKKFDVVLCMFTAINYNLKKSDLLKTLKNFRKHLKDDGVLIFDFPIVNPKQDRESAFALNTKEGKVIALYDFMTRPDLRLTINIYWQIPKGKKKYEVIKDQHLLQGYTIKEYKEVAKKTGLSCQVYWDFSLRKKKGSRPVIVCRTK